MSCNCQVCKRSEPINGYHVGRDRYHYECRPCDYCGKKGKLEEKYSVGPNGYHYPCHKTRIDSSGNLPIKQNLCCGRIQPPGSQMTIHHRHCPRNPPEMRDNDFAWELSKLLGGGTL